jgi:hypothetical protein
VTVNGARCRATLADFAFDTEVIWFDRKEQQDCWFFRSTSAAQEASVKRREGAKAMRSCDDRCGSLKNLILERHAFGIVFFEPFFRGIHICEHLDVVAIANLLARVDINQDCHRILLSFRRCEGGALPDKPKLLLRCRSVARRMPILANSIGPRSSAASISI